MKKCPVTLASRRTAASSHQFLTVFMGGRRVALRREEVREVVLRWRDYADQVGVAPAHRDKIQNALRLAFTG